MDQTEKQSIFDDLLLRSRGRLAAVAGAYAREDADDLLQEILLQIWRSMSTFKGDSSIATWSYRVAFNTGVTWLLNQPGSSLGNPIATGRLSHNHHRAPRFACEFFRNCL